MTHITNCRMPLLLVAIAAMSTIAVAQDSKPKGTADGAIVAKETVKVERMRLTTTVTAKGMVQGDSQHEVKVRLKSWTGPLVVEHAAEHGTIVKKGELLIRFESDKIREQIVSGQEERELAALAIRLAENELPLLRQQLPLDLRAAELQKNQANEDLQRFLEIEKPKSIKMAEFSLRNSEFHLESSRDELKQLEKMYRDKDLTEETEQMILKRYKNSVENAEFSLESTRLQTEQTLKVTLPRKEEEATRTAAKANLSWLKSREELPVTLRQKELTFEKLRHDHRRAQEKLADLEKDLNSMTVTAPADGLLYHGRYSHGQWTGPTATAYSKGGTLPSSDVLMTVVSRDKLFVLIEVEEKEIASIRIGQTARFAPAISPQTKLGGKVERVVPVPRGGKFEVLIALTDEIPAALVPGMTGSAKIMTGETDGPSVPSSAVFEDTESETFYVYTADEKPQKKTVKTGLVGGGRTEILDGLKEGDKILAAKP